nr:rcc1 domain-containing protein 1 [Quercus suber]
MNPAPGTLFAAGFNAHSQLQPNSTNDIRTFVCVPSEASTQYREVLFAGWSNTVLTTSETIVSLGHGLFSHPIDRDSENGMPRKILCAIGDHDGIKACLDETGHLYEQAEVGMGLNRVISDASPSLSHIASAQNERTAIILKQVSERLLCHIIEFRDYERFRNWYQDPNGEGHHPSRHYTLSGVPKQMIANIATFIVLMGDGRVYSWGDPRLRTLGRPVNGEGALPAEEPGLVVALDGLNIVKVANGGWLSAALSEDGALYVWGAAAPGCEHSLKFLHEAEAGEIVLVEIVATDSEPLDILDMAIGDYHIAAVTADGGLFVIGDNTSGQLGLGLPQIFFEDWTKVPSLSSVRSTACGPKSTFAFT